MRDTDLAANSDLFDNSPPSHHGGRLSKAQKRKARREERATREAAQRGRPFSPLNALQAEYHQCLLDGAEVFAIGEAGTGKTYVASHYAMSKLVAGEIERIVISRPQISKTKHKQGFQPGGPREKIEPWLVPIVQAFRDVVSAAALEKMTREGKVDYVAFEFMRGRTFRDAVVILDEAQNCDLSDLKMFLTRQGEGSQVVVCGDPTQVDIPDSGLETVLDMIEDQDLEVDVIEFGPEHVVRSARAKMWVGAFSRLA